MEMDPTPTPRPSTGPPSSSASIRDDPAPHQSTEANAHWLGAPLLDDLELAWRALSTGRVSVADQAHFHRALDELFMFVNVAGHPNNLYSCAGLPRLHNAWEMQLLADGGLLFYLYARCVEALRGTGDHGTGDHGEPSRQLEALFTELVTLPPRALIAQTRRYYAAHIVEFLGPGQPSKLRAGGLSALFFESLIIQAYMRLAICRERSVFTLDLFPAHTGPDNVVQGLKGLLKTQTTSPRSARKFYCCRAESYTRNYGRNLAKILDYSGARGGLTFSLVVPHANSVRHIVVTCCWPIDGAENIARYVDRLLTNREQHHRALGPAGPTGPTAPLHPAGPTGDHSPQILVCGYSQGGAAVRLFNDALSGVDVTARAHFRKQAPRIYKTQARMLTAIMSGAWAERHASPIYTVSVAPMGGNDGVGFAERLPSLGSELADDQRGASGVRSRANTYGGLHLSICHDYDPARWVVPGPLTNIHRRWAHGERKRGLVRILLAFGGPARIFHGGVWTSRTEQAFTRNPAAMALFNDVKHGMLSEVFVDQARYFDPRCNRDAFPHIVMGTFGYPGWVVVTKFAAALQELRELPDQSPDRSSTDAGRRLLLNESSWNCDILPADHPYEQIVATAARFHDRQRRRALAILARVEAATAIADTLRDRYAAPTRRVNLVEAES